MQQYDANFKKNNEEEQNMAGVNTNDVGVLAGLTGIGGCGFLGGYGGGRGGGLGELYLAEQNKDIMLSQCRDKSDLQLTNLIGQNKISAQIQEGKSDLFEKINDQTGSSGVQFSVLRNDVNSVQAQISALANEQKNAEIRQLDRMLNDKNTRALEVQADKNLTISNLQNQVNSQNVIYQLGCAPTCNTRILQQEIRHECGRRGGGGGDITCNCGGRGGFTPPGQQRVDVV